MTKYIVIMKDLSNIFDVGMLIGCGDIKDTKRIGNSFVAKVFLENARRESWLLDFPS